MWGVQGFLYLASIVFKLFPSHPDLKRYQQIQSNTAEDEIVVE